MATSELSLLEIEAQVLQAEFYAATADFDETKLAYELARDSEKPEVRKLLNLMRRNIEACKRLGFPYGVQETKVTIEQSAYAWRRDYGEWPTFWNLSDRYASDRGISRQTASRTILNAMNDNSERRKLYCASSALIDAILEDSTKDWSLPEMQALANLTNLRYYVSPKGLELFRCEAIYATGIRHLEKLTA